jgi:hypothetical protein
VPTKRYTKEYLLSISIDTEPSTEIAKQQKLLWQSTSHERP